MSKVLISVPFSYLVNFHSLVESILVYFLTQWEEGREEAGSIPFHRSNGNEASPGLL